MSPHGSRLLDLFWRLKPLDHAAEAFFYIGSHKKDPTGEDEDEDEQNQKVAEPHLGWKKVDELKMEIDFRTQKKSTTHRWGSNQTVLELKPGLDNVKQKIAEVPAFYWWFSKP